VSDAADLRRLALALPQTYEDVHRRRPAFRIEKRIFAMLGVDDNRRLFKALCENSICVVKLDRDDQLNMAAAFPQVVQPTERYGHHGWTYLRLADLDAQDLAVIVRLAWIHVAPKRLARLLRD